MKSFKGSNMAASLVLLGAFMLQACDGNDSYDIIGNPDNLAYINVDGQINNQLTYTVKKTPIGIENNIESRFPIHILRAVEENITVKVIQDNTLLDEYNEANNTSLLAAPDGLLNINNATLTIERGKTVSAESVSFTVNESLLPALEVGQNYLFPLRITSVSGNNVLVSSNKGCAYLVIEAKYQAVRENGGAADMVGTLIDDYTSWTYSSNHTTGSISYIWNTSTSQRMAFTEDPSTIVFDMQTMKKVSGVRVYARNSNSVSYRLSNAKMALSTDGVEFEEVTNLAIGQMAYADYYQYICMYTSVEARYLKLEMDFVTSNSSYWSLVNLGVYAE